MELAARGNQDSEEIVFFFSLLSSSQLQSFAVFFLMLTTDYFWQLLITLILKAHQLYSKIVDMFRYESDLGKLETMQTDLHEKRTQRVNDQ